MRGASRDIASLACSIRLRSAVHFQGHFTIKDDMRSKPGVRELGIEGAGAVLPHECVTESLRLQLLSQVAFRISLHVRSEVYQQVCPLPELAEKTQ